MIGIVVYEYRMVQIPINVVAEAGAHGSAGVDYLQQLVNFGAEKGWEFYRIDVLGIPPLQSCQVITFRRECVYVAAKPPRTVQPSHQPEPETPADELAVEEKPWWR